MTSNLDGERTDILAGLASARYFLRFAARDLTDEQARQRTTVSELSLGGLIKHVAATENGWATFTLEGPSAPWFEPGARWSARRSFTHIVAETAQHAGHADIIREAIDGQKSMG